MTPAAHDPYQQRVYDAENAALADGGRVFRRFAELERWVESVVLGPDWEAMFPDAPLDVAVLRRSRSATFSAANLPGHGQDAAIWIRDGSWDVVTVVHELAHVAAGTAPDPTGAHGAEFTTALLRLWRAKLGVHAYGALRSALDARAVPYHRARLR